MSVKLKPETITLRKGKVIRYESWVLWNSESWRSVLIEQRGPKIAVIVCRPGHETYALCSETAEVFERFHPEFRRKFENLFKLEHATEHKVRLMGWPRSVEVAQQMG